MDLKDDYRKLGLSNDASLKEVKKAYHEKAQKFHPDKRTEQNLEADNEFKEINNSYHKILDNFTNKTLNDEKISTNTQSTKFSANQKSYTGNNFFNSFDGEIFDLFDILNKIIFENSIIKEKIGFNFRSESQTSEVSSYSSNRCTGKHDKYTICLKCNK